ncbi:Uncaracterized surface protein containing fasciclin (FAS1) repeats [Aquimarina spongiae]|uniref:Uncaracterized surface protein containing fasciclin (FAS1) repeats n=2 Tax=Aquimarina spongiae TaxID=570521 RepID=A0A1M6H9F5_9FLAO|nr:Uncaracterized surface protein containing fasciclin (FAS1) repeats [Aquimarina spongiae]
MKMKNFLKTVLIAFLTITVFSCSDDDDTTFPPSSTTIADFVAANADYSSLLAALEKAELVQTLSEEGSFTVFAPNNAAFDALLTSLGVTLDDLSKDDLTPILLNHVLGSRLTSTQLTTGYSDNLAGFSTYVNTSSGVQINGISTVTQADIEQSNGVIHAVDAVITLPTVTTFAVADPNFDTLQAALTDLTPDTDYATVLSTANGTDPAPFTVFAPTNDAFTDLLDRFNIEIADLTAAQLEIVLNYHVIAGANVLAADLPGIPDGVTPATLQGETLTLNLEGGAFLRDKTGVDSEIIATDVKATNGVIHAIDKVLLPNAALDALGRSFTAVAFNGGEASDFSSLYAALRITGLNDALDSATMRTVFAPTNTAFDALLDGASLEDLPVATVTQILLNHVIDGKLLSTDLSTSYANTLATFGDTMNNLSIYINTSSGVVLNGGMANGGATVATPNVETRNGVIHVVDAVIGLPTVVTFAVADSNFSTLVSALTDLTPATDFVSVLSTANGTDPAPFTVFAPTNDAFSAITIPGESELTPILQYHVVAGANVRAADLSDGQVVTTLETGTFTVNVGSSVTITDENSRVTNVVVTDVQAVNGVIHVVDQVLLPMM